MGGDDVLNPEDSPEPFSNPWPAVMVGASATAVAWILSLVLPESWMLACAAFLVVGLPAAAAAVVIRPRSAAVLASASAVAFLASLVTASSKVGWDSATLLLRVMASIAFVSALLVLLPRIVRLVAVSLLIAFHFIGILSAVTNVPPAPWLSTQLWVYVYRPYLQFLYMNNAYHFYSPNPGPAALVWFRIEYEPKDGKRYWRWVYVPELDKEGEARRPDGKRLWPHVEYTRRLSLAVSLDTENLPLLANFQELQRGRMAAGKELGIPSEPEMLQYKEPNPTSKIWLKSYVRHLAHTYKHQEHPELEVVGVKVYRVIHAMLYPPDFAEGRDPNDPSLYLPFYTGEYDKDGEIKPDCQIFEKQPDGTQQEVYRDPFLYWLIPITRYPKVEKPGSPEDWIYRNYVLVHAGDVPPGSLP